MRTVLAITFVLAVTSSTCGTPLTRPFHAAPVVTPAASGKRALLVGVDRYAAGTPSVFAPLSGCVADARRVRDLLVQRFAFDPKDILVLENEAATHAAIVRAFHEHLIVPATNDTEVVFWFSGHGSRVPDVSGVAGAELDRKDSSLLAHDSRANGADGEWDLCDDELRSLLFALTRKTPRVTVVTDACHSGGTMRSSGTGGTRSRGADEGKRPLDRERLAQSAWPKDLPLLEDGDPRVVEADRYVHVSACAPHELAQELELPREDGAKEHGGALTLFLLQALDAARPGQTYRDIADQAAIRLSTRFPSQNPWYEGGLSRELFGARFAERPPGFLARATQSGLRIDAGKLHGLAQGAVLAVHAADGALVGRVEVVAAGTIESSAEWHDPRPSKSPEGALRVVEESRPAGQAPLRVAVEAADSEAAQARAKSLAGELANDPRVELANVVEPGVHRFTLDARGRAAFSTDDGLVLWKEAGAPETGSWSAAVRDELRHHALVALAATPGALRVEGTFRAPSTAELDRWRAKSKLATGSAHPAPAQTGAARGASTLFTAVGTERVGEELALAMIDVKNVATAPIFLHVLSVTEARGCDLVWPGEGERDRVLAPGEALSIPVNVTIPATWPRERPMRDRYLLVATRKAVDLSPLVTREKLRSSQSLPGVLEAAMSEVRTRGARAVRVDGADWGVGALDLLVGRAAK